MKKNEVINNVKDKFKSFDYKKLLFIVGAIIVIVVAVFAGIAMVEKVANKSNKCQSDSNNSDNTQSDGVNGETNKDITKEQVISESDKYSVSIYESGTWQDGEKKMLLI